MIVLKKLANFYLFVLLGMVFLVSCGISNEEIFEPIDFREFNERVKNSSASPEELIKSYYHIESVGEEDITVQVKKIGWFSESYHIVLVHENVRDDSIVAFKIVMQAKKIATGWEVTELKKNFRCQEGRGHPDWGIEWCR